MSTDPQTLARERAVLDLIAQPEWGAFAELVEVAKKIKYTELLHTSPEADPSGVAACQGFLQALEQILTLEEKIKENLRAEEEQ